MIQNEFKNEKIQYELENWFYLINYETLIIFLSGIYNFRKKKKINKRTKENQINKRITKKK